MDRMFVAVRCECYEDGTVLPIGITWPDVMAAMEALKFNPRELLRISDFSWISRMPDMLYMGN